MQVGAVLTVAILFQAAPTWGADGVSADQLADQMLAALGGRQAWAELRNTINGSRQNRVDEPTVVHAVITMDFERPRFKIETTAPGIRVVRVIDGDNSWRLRLSGNVEGVPASLYEEEMQWYGAHLYRTIHRVAARDSAISIGTDESGRLLFYDDGARIMWFSLDGDGQPYGFGTYENVVGSLLGPWSFEEGGIRHPAWVSSPDGTWRAAVRSLSVNVPLQDPVFARPADH